MSAFHQMGHDSRNLLDEADLLHYQGAILSPVNYGPDQVAEQIAHCRPREGFQTYFDPQLYVPTTERGHLREWAYFPPDVDTADLSSDGWWRQLVKRLREAVEGLTPTAVCSPAIVPTVFGRNDYFEQLVNVGSMLQEELEGTELTPIQTCVVSLAELALTDRAEAVASIISRTACASVYLLLLSELEPRRELAAVDELKGAMWLINALSAAGLAVTVGCSSADLVLWKAAGAANCATGKFFNLRRFNRSRWEEPTQGGGQLAYWFEEALLGFLRETDLLRLKDLGLLSESSEANPYGRRILEQIETEPEKAWVALGWRQYMHWFADMELRLEHGEEARTLLQIAERNWLQLEDQDVLMEEPRNDGSWLRPWRRALAEFRRR